MAFPDSLSVSKTYFPFNGMGWYDWIFGLLAGLYIPLNMHYRMDCYSASALAIDWFVSSNRVWNVPFGLRS